MLSFVGALIVLASNIVAGHRLHLWLVRNTGVVLPVDAGAWSGLLFGLYLLFF